MSDEFPSFEHSANAAHRPKDVSSSAKPARHDPAADIVHSPSTSPGEAKDQGVEEEKCHATAAIGRQRRRSPKSWVSE